MKWIFISLPILILLLIGGMLFYFNGSKNIADIKNESFVGKKLSLRGEVESVIKIGQLSGFTLKDDTGSIPVLSADLPAEGENVKVRGILMKDSLFGYYLKSD